MQKTPTTLDNSQGDYYDRSYLGLSGVDVFAKWLRG